MSRTEISSNKHVDLHSTISFKIEMLRKKVQTHYQSLVYHQSKYFPRHPPHLSPPMFATSGCYVERMCWLKGQFESQWHCASHDGVLDLQSSVILVDDINSWKYCGVQSSAKYIIYACGGISPMFIICDMRLLSCGVHSIISDGWS